MTQSNLYQVYILQNNKGIFYIGLSEDIALRLEQHNRGISNWTRSRGPWSLVWASASMPLSEAGKLERLLKRQKGGRGFYKLTGLTSSSGS